MKRASCLLLVLAPLLIAASTDRHIDARVVATFTPLAVGPMWAEFSPDDPPVVVMLVGSDSFLIEPYTGTVTKIGRPGVPAGWLLGGILWKAGDNYSILDTSGPERTIRTLARVDLPRTVSRGEDLKFVMRSDPGDLVDVPVTSPGGTIQRRVFAYLVPRRFAIGGEESRAIVDAKGALLEEFSLKIYGITVSPDSHKLVISFGEENVVWNSLTNATINLPVDYSSWRWLPDSSTLVGSKEEMPESGQEVVARSSLAIFETTASRLEPLRLPKPYDDAVLDVLAISPEGLLLIRAHREIPETKELGWIFVAPIWR